MPTYPADPFFSSRAGFDVLVAKLSGEGAAALTHGEVERLIEDDGRELLRLLMQDHVHLLGVKEEASIQPMRAADGVLRSEKRLTSRVLGTLFGDIGVGRLTLVKRGAVGGLRPLDAQLNLPVGKYSEGVSRRLAWEVAQCSYDAAVANLRRTTGTTLAKRQAEELAVGLVEDFDADLSAATQDLLVEAVALYEVDGQDRVGRGWFAMIAASVGTTELVDTIDGGTVVARYDARDLSLRVSEAFAAYASWQTHPFPAFPAALLVHEASHLSTPAHVSCLNDPEDESCDEDSEGSWGTQVWWLGAWMEPRRSVLESPHCDDLDALNRGTCSGHINLPPDWAACDGLCSDSTAE